ncbi:uncharacterized protein BDR25DRAFT_67149 [Lindgomyces ingoldianus]|uniref:Uncharacterized protein n=1 Tax=Lindgomyces ingoldianus TaxID=673940 RepID=A0ACB6RDY7_9PLEO|nr:uncharacterized protein BDR25DRAFT_67149 [Lindgomyces ingoldianus]KAF2476542.1 hypothetical protein BDR25DRAFT_67149 [Lindgomyces ingoldianus]
MESASPPAPVHNYQNVQEGIWPNGPVQLARGRQAKDPNAKTISYTVTSLEEFETSLREYLREPPEQPEHTECQLSFWIGASFLVSTPSQPATQNAQRPHQASQAHALHPQAPPGYQPANGLHPQYGAPALAPHTYQSVADPAIALTLPSYAPSSSASGSNNRKEKDLDNKISLSILEALAPTNDPKEKMRKQRAIAKCCVDSIQKCDGYRYSFHNCWNSREDDSFRFSYYCNDSLLNKDRAANGKGAKLGKRATKPVYDCRGVLAVKFSANKQSLDVFYKHIPIHKTYEERAPPPRKDSKRRKHLEQTDPEALIRIANRPKPPKPPEQGSANPDAPPRPKKRKAKRDDIQNKQTAQSSIESDLRAQSLRSLLELIQTDPAPEPLQGQQPQQSLNRNVEEEPPPRQPLPLPPPQPQPPAPPQQSRRRPRNSCDVCKTKKTKCDGTRPVCHTCLEKKRQCIYSEPPPDEHRQSAPHPSQPVASREPVRQAQAASSELSELEKTKKELEEAKARIQQLEAEKTHGSTTPSQTPQPPPSQQIQTPQYGHFRNHASHASYGMNRSMQPQSAPHQPQATPQMHPSGTGLTPTQDSSNPYSNSRGFNWGATPYFYEQPTNIHQTPQQHQQDQWAAARSSGVFR